MIEDPLDEDGYPTDEALEYITEWSDYGRFKDLMGFVESLWTYPNYFTKEPGCDMLDRPARYRISTGGWSGNESIISALQENTMFWLLNWVESRRGGHYVFEIQE